VLVGRRGIRHICTGAGITLGTPIASDVGVVLQIGEQRYCARFGGRSEKNDARVLRRRNARPPGQCPDPCAVCDAHARCSIGDAGVSCTCTGGFAGDGRSCAPAPFVTFESGQVRPLALAPDGSRLYAVNTPDDRLEIFDVDANGDLVHAASVPVGLEPVAVAAHADGHQVWVVNHLSDSVSVVDVAATPPHVVRTLLVGDEPRDVVFAGPGGSRAFVTAAHRGQTSGVPLVDLTTAGIGRADVWVFDTGDPGTPLTKLTLFGDTPRALATSPDGNTVYAAVFESGNRTATLSEGLVCDGGAAAPPCSVAGVPMPGGLPAPNTDCFGNAQPETGLIVRWNPAHAAWEDGLGRDWGAAVRFSLPDEDVFAIDAVANPPVETGMAYAGVGTILFDMATNPVTGKIYVSNTEARNDVRFEGPGTCPGNGRTNSTVRGHLHEARITVLDGASVLPRHLNTHLDTAASYADPGPAEKARSLATPLGMAVTPDGSTLYVAAFGSSAVGRFSTAELEADAFVPSAASHIAVSGGGPSGLALRGERLYVLTRFDDGISVIDTAAGAEIAHVRMHDPEPASVTVGRRLLYDAVGTSGNGEAACASCHVFGDFDGLAWDLGNPDAFPDTGGTLPNPNPFRVTIGEDQSFHALKGPMTTQSLRGLASAGPMHWRGDRTAGNDPGGRPLDENGAFLKFIVAFDGLLGKPGGITATEMQQLADFVLQVTYPPNPIRNLDGSLTADQQAGRDFYFNVVSDSVQTCSGCHQLDPARGFFGTDGFSSFENETQDFKVPHLRNAYQKVGMFGMAALDGGIHPGDNGDRGPQVRGFGFLHDGSVDTLFRFHRAVVFDGGFDANGGDATRRQVEQFVLAYDSNLAPIVGQQVTLTSTNAGTANPRIDLLVARAAAGDCELVVKGNVGGVARGAVRRPDGTFRMDRAADPPVADAALRALAAVAGQELTYTAVPPASGTRIGIDRDLDGCLDQDDADPTDPAVCTAP
jgi:YVTN family beta-propeller protein